MLRDVLRHSVLSASLFVVAVGSLVLVSSVSADEQQDRKKLAVISLDDVDQDFAYTGEYEGFVNSADNIGRPIGLQVTALGDGEFGGMQYQGGLPGTGWNRSDRKPISGKRAGDLVTIETEGRRIEIAIDAATVVADDGRVLGQLSKVHRKSATLGMPAPANAYTLFDGYDTTQFVNGKMSNEGLLIEGTEFVSRFRDFTMHLEYRLPYMPYARGQGRSNSGVYLQSSYEVQVLDSFGLEGIENECGSLYRYRRPDINMCLPPLSWQTYDLTFRSPRLMPRAIKSETRGSRCCTMVSPYMTTLRSSGKQGQENRKPIFFVLRNYKTIAIRFAIEISGSLIWSDRIHRQPTFQQPISSPSRATQPPA